MQLIYEDGEPVQVGDIVVDFRGETAVVQDFFPPKHPGSTGRVQTTLGLHYPGVYNLKWDHRKVIGPLDI